MSSASDQDKQARSRRGEGRGEARISGVERRPYERPRLEVLGDVRDVTLGATPGSGDSNDPTNFRF